MSWAVIPDFPEYSVNRLGEIRRDATGHVLAPKVNQYGVVYVGLMKNGRQRQRSIARLVAYAFLHRRRGPMDTPINKNGDRFDNRVENLAWRPRWYAVKYNHQFRNPYENPIQAAIRNIETDESYKDSWDCAISNGLLERDVVLSILNRTYTAITFQRFELLDF
jgi:hypothetical protein